MSGVLKATTLVGRKVEKANRSEQPTDVSPMQSCPNKNWIDLYYKYPSDRPVSFADYIIFNENGEKVATGKLDINGYSHVTGLPQNMSSCTVVYTGDPKPFEIYNDRKGIKNPYYQAASEQQQKKEDPLKPLLANALVVAHRVVQLAIPYSQARYEAAQWTWGAIQGDWNDDQTLGQIVFDSALSMIPVVDQVADVRDVCANLYQLTVKRRYDEFGPWFGLVMTVIGMVPEIGTAIKGAVKSVIKVGKEAAGFVLKKGVKFAEQLIAKSGINIGELIRVMNYFGEGNVIRWLREQIGKFDVFKKWVMKKIRDILLNFREKCLSLKTGEFESIDGILSSVANSIDETLSRVDEYVGEIMERGKKELDDVTKQVEDYSIKATTQTQNGAIQLAQPPPLAPALERHKKRLLDIEDAAKKAGMEPAELKGLIKNSKEKGRRTVVRFTNDKALKWHGKDGFLPKNVDVKLKTAKDGPNAGLVVRPKGEPHEWEEWERQNVRYLESKGYEFDGAGRLVDGSGNRYYGDYDLQAVHRQAKDENGKDIFMEELSEPGVIDDINADVGQTGRFKGQEKPIQHGAENDFWVKTDEKGEIIVEPKYGKTTPATEEDIRAGRATLGRQHGDDEQYLVVHPDGSIEILKDPAALHDMYRKEGDVLPWNYNNKPASGEAVKAEQARRQARKEAYEKMSVAEIKAEQTQMQRFIDDIIGDGKQFVTKPPTDSGAMPFFMDNSLFE